MNKIIFSLAFAFAVLSFAPQTSAATFCGNPANSDVNTTYVNCANGPIVAQKLGGRFLKPGQEDCPIWFPYTGCYTMRTLGQLR